MIAHCLVKKFFIQIVCAVYLHIFGIPICKQNGCHITLNSIFLSLLVQATVHFSTTILCNTYCRSWRNNVRSKVSQPNQLDIYQTLCMMETELDEEEFKEMVCSFVRHWEKKEAAFIKYFQENYLNRCGKK